MRMSLTTSKDGYPEIAFATDDYVAVQVLVAAGLGVALLPGLALLGATRAGVAEGAPSPTVEAVFSAGARRSPAVTAMLDALAEASAEL